MLRLVTPLLVVALLVAEAASACGGGELLRAAIPTQLTLPGTLVTLTTPDRRHYRAVSHIYSDAKTMEFHPHLHRKWDAAAIGYKLQGIAMAQARGEVLDFVILHNESQRIVGTISLSGISPEKTTTELGLIVYHAYWGTGVAAEAHQLLVDYAFSQLGMTAIEYMTFTENGRMRGFFAKAGIPLVREGLENWFGARRSVSHYELRR